MNKTQLIAVAKKDRTKALTGVTLGGIVSFTSGYFFAKNRLQTKYEKIAEQEISEAKKFYGKLHKTDEDLETPNAALQTYGHNVVNLGYRSPLDGPVSETEVEGSEARLENIEEKVVDVVNETVQEAVTEIKNVFEDGFDYERELRTRDEAFPYVISHDEFYTSNDDYPQVTLTYFEGDDVLTDERDQPINESDVTVGDANLTLFGHGSKDNNIVYIRNERLEIDFEVVRSQGHYVKEVLGFIEHSERRGKTRKFRSDDG